MTGAVLVIKTDKHSHSNQLKSLKLALAVRLSHTRGAVSNALSIVNCAITATRWITMLESAMQNNLKSLCHKLPGYIQPATHQLEPGKILVKLQLEGREYSEEQ